MLVKTKGIVLNRIKYSDTAIICSMYTLEFGKLSFMIHGSNSKKSKLKSNLLQPLYLLDLEIIYKDNAGLQKLNEISIDVPLNDIPFSFVKNSVSFFIAEFTNKCLKENDKDKALFDFIKNSILFLDNLKENAANFHIKYLLEFLKYLGIYPENNFSESQTIFDMEAGKFILGRPFHKNFTDIETSALISKFLETDVESSHKTPLSKSMRNKLLNMIIDYSNIHIEKPGKLKSIDVLNEIFA